ncbi:hypothetical protein FRC04_004974 [Tulasnella sp. 424]|nr:hypothetical protein FRC04_004974 [Tulasnella sp. 424]KAG8970164.1 hypothetical protein FRC05_000685 [Tulasnella sp. 425]
MIATSPDSSPQSSVPSPSDALIPLASRDVEPQGLNKGPIYRVLEDVLFCIFHDVVLPPHPGRHLATLGLVCRHWREILESASTLWTYISAGDNLSHVQKALRHTGQVPLDIVFPEDAQCRADDFFPLVKDKIRYWRTMDITLSESPYVLLDLQTSKMPLLETLRISHLYFIVPIDLFEEPSLPSKLTELRIHRLSVTIPPWLANLDSLSLEEVGHVTMEDLLRILQNSPNLKILKLKDMDALKPNKTIPHITHLRSLISMELWLPVAVTRYLLSGLRINLLSHLLLSCNMNNASPRGNLLSNNIGHFIPTIREMVSRAAVIDFNFRGSGIYSIDLGDLFFEFDVLRYQKQYRFALDAFEWLTEVLGPDFREIPARLKFHNLNPRVQNLELYGSFPQPRVVEIVLQVSDFHTTGSPPVSVLQYLSSPRQSDPSQWPFPHLETIKYHLEESLNNYLVEMLRGRYGDPKQIQQAALQPPQPLKKIKIYGVSEGDIAQPNMGFLKEVQNLAAGAKIFWQDEVVTFA